MLYPVSYTSYVCATETSIVRTRTRNTLNARRRPGRSCCLKSNTETKSPFGH